MPIHRGGPPPSPARSGGEDRPPEMAARPVLRRCVCGGWVGFPDSPGTYGGGIHSPHHNEKILLQRVSRMDGYSCRCERDDQSKEAYFPQSNCNKLGHILYLCPVYNGMFFFLCGLKINYMMEYGCVFFLMTVRTDANIYYDDRSCNIHEWVVPCGSP
jgi:hypothetical protein